LSYLTLEIISEIFLIHVPYDKILSVAYVYYLLFEQCSSLSLAFRLLFVIVLSPILILLKMLNIQSPRKSRIFLLDGFVVIELCNLKII
jgi:hypothetical protein